MSERDGTANLLGMARTAMLGGNQQEALGYFNRVLEIDPTVSEAWMGKGKAAAWQSSLMNLRLGEATIAFSHAIANADDKEKEAAISEAVDEINKIVVALYGMGRQHLVEFASLDNTWPTYLSQVAQMIDTLDEARKWQPLNRITLENIVHLCKDNIEGYVFRDSLNNHVSVAHGITPDYESFLRGKMDLAISSLQQIDPSYAPPLIEKKQAEACFVVTATMGDENHPHVLLLRSFRDDWLLKKKWGTRVVRHYYSVGPVMAAQIARSALLRTLSYRVIVRPAVSFAKRKLR